MNVIRLAARWKFSPDSENTGVQQEWFAQSYDDSSWDSCRTDLEKGWESQGYSIDSGYGWYRQQIELPAGLTAKHIYIYFGAVDEDAWVYINGKLSLDHSCEATGMTPEQIWDEPFVFDAAKDIVQGQKNTLAVRVHNSSKMGGIWQPVYLVVSDSELDLADVQSVAIKN